MILSFIFSFRSLHCERAVSQLWAKLQKVFPVELWGFCKVHELKVCTSVLFHDVQRKLTDVPARPWNRESHVVSLWLHTHCLYIYKASNQGCYFCLETSKLLFLIFILILSLWSVVISSHKSRKRHFRHSHMLAWDQTQHHFCALWKLNLQKIMFFWWDPPKIDCPLTNKWFQKVNDPLGEEKTEFNGISLYY